MTNLSKQSIREIVSGAIRKHIGIETSSEIEKIAQVMEAVEAYATQRYKEGERVGRELEFSLIPVIETTGVGYEVIVSHRKERWRQLHLEAKRAAKAELQSNKGESDE